MPEASAARSAVLGLDVLAVFEMNEGPVLRVALEDDMTSAAAVTSVGPALGDVLLAPQMCGAVAAVTRGAEDQKIFT